MAGVIIWIALLGIFAYASLNARKKKEVQNEIKSRLEQVSQLKYKPSGKTIAEKRPRVDEYGLSEEELEERRQEQMRRTEALERKRYSMNKAGKAAAQDALVAKVSDGFTLQDTKHDWLAGQLAEEQRAYRAVSEMFQVKMSHLSNCRAENLRLDHVLNCDARKLAEDSRMLSRS